MGELADAYINRILEMKAPAGYMKRRLTDMATTLNDVRFSYCNLFQPKAPINNPNGEPKYSVTVLVPKTNAAAKAAMDAAIQEAIQAGVNAKWNGQMPPVPNVCVHDGDGVRPSDGMPYGEECRGCWVFTASSKQAPFVVDANVQNIMDPRVIYSGMWGNVSVNFFAYNQAGKKGIGCGLNGVQKIRDDTPLSAHVTAEEAFKPAAPAAPAPAYGQPVAPGATPWGAPVAPAPGYGQPAAPVVDPITGQPMAPQGYNPSGAPIMGL